MILAVKKHGVRRFFEDLIAGRGSLLRTSAVVVLMSNIGTLIFLLSGMIFFFFTSLTGGGESRIIC